MAAARVVDGREKWRRIEGWWRNGCWGGAAAREGAAAWEVGGGGGPGQRRLGLRKRFRQGSIRYLIPYKFGRKGLCASIILIDRALGTYIDTRGSSGVLSPKIQQVTEGRETLQVQRTIPRPIYVCACSTGLGLGFILQHENVFGLGHPFPDFWAGLPGFWLLFKMGSKLEKKKAFLGFGLVV